MGEIEIPRKKEYRIKMDNETFETPRIVGKLNGLIIDSKETVSVTITSSLGYLIFHNSMHAGVIYYAPRAVLQGAKANLIIQDQFDKFVLDESLDIRVSGPNNAETMITLRID